MESKSSYNKDLIFKFNLIPPKSKQEIIVLEKRDNSILNSFLFVFLGVFIFFILNTLQTFVTAERLNESKISLLQQEATLKSYDQIRIINGELITKANILEPVLERDIKITELLATTELITKDFSGVSVTTYSREPTGEFVLTMNITDIKTIIDLIVKMNSIESISSTFVRSVNINRDNSINLTVSFLLKNL